jgi:hypothetical protein
VPDNPSSRESIGDADPGDASIGDADPGNSSIGDAPAKGNRNIIAIVVGAVIVVGAAIAAFLGFK